MSLGQHAPHYGLQMHPLFWFIRPASLRDLGTFTRFSSGGDVEAPMQ
jgi:hypothetical protein